jgi:hypothetical protein
MAPRQEPEGQLVAACDTRHEIMVGRPLHAAALPSNVVARKARPHSAIVTGAEGVVLREWNAPHRRVFERCTISIEHAGFRKPVGPQLDFSRVACDFGRQAGRIA